MFVPAAKPRIQAPFRQMPRPKTPTVHRLPRISINLIDRLISIWTLKTPVTRNEPPDITLLVLQTFSWILRCAGKMAMLATSETLYSEYICFELACFVSISLNEIAISCSLDWIGKMPSFRMFLSFASFSAPALADWTTQQWDAIIVGAGPAGIIGRFILIR